MNKIVVDALKEISKRDVDIANQLWIIEDAINLIRHDYEIKAAAIDQIIDSMED